MERELAEHLLLVARAFAKARGLKLSTLGRMAAWDGRFFDNLLDPTKSFTARKYDQVLAYFSAHWPGDAIEWPEHVARPDVEEWSRVLERVRSTGILETPAGRYGERRLMSVLRSALVVAALLIVYRATRRQDAREFIGLRRGQMHLRDAQRGDPRKNSPG